MEYDYCVGCKEHCCKQPLMTIPEYQNICKMMGKESLPHSLRQGHGGRRWVRLTQRECPAFQDNHCIIPHDDRPHICQMYPWEVVWTANDAYKLLLNVNTCERWRDWGNHWNEAKTHFEKIRRKVRF
jgi:hypothetical protein